MTARLIGGPDLRARLASLADASPEYATAWAQTTMEKARATTPAPAIRRGSNEWFTRTGTGPRGGIRAAVYGAFWWLFVDRGRKASLGLSGGNPPNLLRFKIGGETIFAPRAKRVARRPFITRAAQEALEGAAWSDTIQKLWRRRRLGSHQRFL